MADVEAYYRRYFPAIREKCRRMLGHAGEADDVAQETFVKLWRSSVRDSDPRATVSWIYRTSTRLAIDRMRSRARRQEVGGEAEDAALEAASPAPLADDLIGQRRSLERLARDLPADELEVALLHRLDGLTQPEIAELLGVTDRTVRRILVRLDERTAQLAAAQDGGR